MPDLTTIRSPKPTTLTVPTEIGAVTVTYNRTEAEVVGIPRYVRPDLAQLLIAWDVTNEGAPMQPQSFDDVAYWQGVVRERRAGLRAAWERQKAAHAAATPELAAKLEPIGLEPPEADAPITMQERRAAYVGAWEAILAQLPVGFLRTIYDGVSDDFLGVTARTNATPIG